MNQSNGTVTVTREQLGELLEVSRACYMLNFYNKDYKVDYNLYSKEMMENKIHFIFQTHGALDEYDEIELSHEEIRTIFNDTVLKVSYFYPAYEYMTWKDMTMVKEIFDKFDIFLLTNTSSKLILQKYSFASLCCVCCYFGYMQSSNKEIDRFRLQRIIQSARDRKRTRECDNGHYNENMKIHNNAQKLSLSFKTKREQYEDYEIWYNGLTGKEQRILQEFDERQKKIKRELQQIVDAEEEEQEEELEEELEEREMMNRDRLRKEVEELEWQRNCIDDQKREEEVFYSDLDLMYDFE